MSIESNKQALSRAISAWNAQNLDQYLQLYAADIRLYGYSPEPMNKTAVRGFYLDFRDAFPGSHLVVDEIVGERDLLMLRFHLDLTHSGAFMGVAPTGKTVALTGHTSMQFKDEHVIARWSTADFLGLLTQLGALPMPS
jgi:predicted ester cyclase